VLGSWSGILKETDHLADQRILDIDVKIRCKGTGLDGVSWGLLPQGRDNKRTRLNM
jgi:hypothetical protein